MTDESFKGTNAENASNSEFNAITTLVERFLENRVSTAIPVRVDEVTPGERGPVGKVSITPLVAHRDANNNVLEMSSIHDVPYIRLQGGVCAVIVDPVPGDIGLAVFAKRDISILETGTTKPVQPGSFRMFDEADALYLGGLLNKEPEIFIEMIQDGDITAHAPRSVRIEAVEDNVDIEAGNNVTVVANADVTVQATGNVSVSCDGSVTVEAGGDISAQAGGSAQVTASGNISASASGNITLDAGGSLTISASSVQINTSSGIHHSGGHLNSNGTILETHIHGGVESGPSTTSPPL